MSNKSPNTGSCAIANSSAQPLIDHGPMVAEACQTYVRSHLLPDPLIEASSFLGGLTHDAGKFDPDFQAFMIKTIKATDPEVGQADAERGRYGHKKWHGVYHHELSWYAIRLFLRGDDELLDLVCFSVYWHHAAERSKKGNGVARPTAEHIALAMGERRLEAYLTEVYPYLCRSVESFNKAYPSLSLRIQKFDPGRLALRDITVPRFYNPGSAGYDSRRHLVLVALISSDQKVSRAAAGRDTYPKPSSYLEGLVPTKQTTTPGLASPRSLTQTELVKKMLGGASIISAAMDAGSGKTRIGLLINALNEAGPRRVVWLVATKMEGDAMFQTIGRDISAIYGENSAERISVELSYGGIVQQSRGCTTPLENKAVLSSDVNILVFDRFLSSLYKGGRFNEMARILESHVVVDEWDKLEELPKMLPFLRKILLMRSRMQAAAKTVLLSATPAPAMLRLISEVFTPAELSHYPRKDLAEQRLSTCTYEVADCPTSTAAAAAELNDIHIFKPTIAGAKDVASRLVATTEQRPVLVHSQLKDEHRHEQLSGLDAAWGPGADARTNPLRVVSARSLERGVNISSTNCIIAVLFPSSTLQASARTNRFGKKPGGRIILDLSAEAGLFHESAYGSRWLHDAYVGYLNTVLATPLALTKRAASTLLFDDFWTPELTEKHYRQLKQKLREAELFMSEQAVPFKLPKKIYQSKTGGGSNIFRDASRPLTAKIVDEQGEPTGMLGPSECLSEGSPRTIGALKRALGATGASEIKALNYETTFSYDKYRLASQFAGSRPEIPFFSSHMDAAIDQKLRALLGTDAKGFYRIYHPYLGLCSERELDDYLRAQAAVRVLTEKKHNS